MVFIFGVNFPERRLLKSALESFFGIGPHTSSRLLAKHYHHNFTRVGDLNNNQVLEINTTLSSMTVENDLRRKVLQDIKRLRDTGMYRGRRHAMSLPVRGQNTRNQTKNANKLNRVERNLGA